MNIGGSLKMWIVLACAIISGTLRSQEEVLVQCENANLHYLEGRVEAFNLGVDLNTQYSEYNPVFVSNSRHLYYASRHDSSTGEEIYGVDRQFYEDILMAEQVGEKFLAGASVFDADSLAPFDNTEEHDAPVFVSGDDSIFIFYRDQKLWMSTLTDSGYTESVELPKEINRGRYQRHASLTADKKTIFFSSEVFDKSTNRFHYDIFYSTKDSAGAWKRAKALPHPINTLFDEDSPEINTDGTQFFFSSDRPGGFGGYDVYNVELKDGMDDVEITLLCEPVNSAAHDIYFKLAPDSTHAFFSSNRLGGFGNQDIYKLILDEARFDTCVALQRGERVTLDITESVDRNGAELTYSWDFGDGGKAEGTEVSHLYTKPGDYTIVMNATDRETGMVYYNEILEEVSIEFASGYMYIEGMDTVKVDLDATYSAERSRMFGRQPLGAHWETSHGMRHRGEPFTTSFSQQGQERVYFEGIIIDPENDRHASCVYKKVDVVSDELFEAYSKRNSVKTESDLMSESEILLATTGRSSDENFVLRNDFVTTLINTPISIDVLANDSSKHGLDMEIFGVKRPVNGKARQEGRMVDYTPNQDFKGLDNFEYIVHDERGHENKAIVVVKVVSESEMYEGQSVGNDYASVTGRDSIIVEAGKNDNHPHGDKQKLVSVTPPRHGEISVLDSAAKRFSYTPNESFQGQDAFVYQVEDSQGIRSSAYVVVEDSTLQVVASTERDISKTEGGQSIQIDLFANDNLDRLELPELVSIIGPDNGVVRIVDRQKGTVVYVPSPSFRGVDAFTYTVRDKNGVEFTEGVSVVVGNRDDASSLHARLDRVFVKTEETVKFDVTTNDYHDQKKAFTLKEITRSGLGSWAMIDKQSGTIEFQAGAEAGVDTVEYTIVDAEGILAKSQVILIVSDGSGQQLMALTEDRVETVVEGPIVIDVFKNDVHLKNRNMELYSVSTDNGGEAAINSKYEGEIYYMPKKGFVGQEIITYTVMDSHGKRATSRVIVNVYSPFDADAIDVTNRPDLGLENIYFDLDQDSIRKKEFAVLSANIEKLKANPDVVIKVRSHCDSRGRMEYNLDLSSRRAKETVAYLIKEGISAERIISSLGLGEAELVNDCGDDADCNEEQHQLNRRSEFVVIGTLKK